MYAYHRYDNRKYHLKNRLRRFSLNNTEKRLNIFKKNAFHMNHINLNDAPEPMPIEEYSIASILSETSSLLKSTPTKIKQVRHLTTN